MLLFYGIAAAAQSPGTFNPGGPCIGTNGYLCGFQENQSNIPIAINMTSSYVNSINQSSYLVFYPNLTASYKYLNEARTEFAANQTYAYSLLSKARQSATEQQTSLLRYQSLSLYILAASSILLAIILYIYMKPHQYKGRKPKG